MLNIQVFAQIEIARDFLINISAGFVGAVLLGIKEGSFDVKYIIWSIMELVIVCVCYRLSVHLNTKIYEWRRNMD